MKWLNSIRSFGTKLILLVTLTTGAAVLMVCAFLIAVDHSGSLQQSLAIARAEANIVAINCEAPLAFPDPDTAVETLHSLRAVENIGSATLLDASGAVFARYRDDVLVAPDFGATTPGILQEGPWVIITERIIGPTDELLGRLQVVFDFSSLQEQLWQNIGLALLVAAITTAIAFLAATRMQSFLVRPVGELASTAARVTKSRDYSIRATKFGDDELGQLTDLFNDMLSRVQTQTDALHSAQSQFRMAVEAAPNAMVMVNEQGNIVLANAQAERLFNYTRTELIGQPVEVLVPERFRTGHPVFRNAFFADAQARPMGAGRDLFGRRKNGDEVPVEIGLNPIRTEHGMMVLSSIVDITERKRIELEREGLLEAERAARSEAERASRMKDEFVATLSHELRTPLSAILGWSQMLRNASAPPEEQSKGLEIIERNARVQTQIIEDLLDMSRIVSGKIRLDVQQVNLADVIEAALATVRPAAEAKGIRLQSVIDPRVSPVRGDSSRLQQIVWNLLSNAIKFTHRDGRVQIALERVNSHIEITISDTGMGISPDFLPHLFERFRQADSSTTRRHAGLGLGLSIVKQLVELHGGSVKASSPGEGKGSTFVVSLPLMVLHHEDPPVDRIHPRLSVAPGNPSDRHPALDGLKVLVVDDEPDARELVGRLLERVDVRVACAGSAGEAIELFQKFNPDVFISDIGMPDVDGYELIRRIRAAEAGSGRSTPALALTAFARSEDRTRALLAGYQMHLAKPVEPAELIATVASLAGKTGISPHRRPAS